MKKPWSLINEVLNKTETKDSFSQHSIIDGHAVSDKIAIAYVFNNFFTNVGIKLAKDITVSSDQKFEDYLQKEPGISFSLKYVFKLEINKSIDKLDTKRNYGFNGISNVILKSFKSRLLKPLTVIINQMLQSRMFLEKLKIAKIIPLYKKGDKTILTDYRPILLLPSLSIFLKTSFLTKYRHIV